MEHAVSGNPWRKAADAVTLALGINLWAALVFVPALFVGAIQSPPTALVCATPLVALVIGLITRRAILLLLLYPLLLLVPLVADGRIIASNIEGVGSFALLGGSLIAFLLGASFMSAFHEPTPADRSRKLVIDRPGEKPRTTMPARWARRFRLFNALFVLSIVFPLVLLYAINFAPQSQRYMRGVYLNRTEAMKTVMNLGLLVWWLALFATHFLAPLKDHRTGDKQIRRELSILRGDITRAAPRPAFYFGVLGALGFMGLLMYLRYR